MPISASIFVPVIPNIVANGSVVAVSIQSVATTTVTNLEGQFTTDTFLSISFPFIVNESGFANQVGDFTNNIKLNVDEFLYQFVSTLTIFERDLTTLVYLQSVVGDIPPHSNPFKVTGFLNTYDSFRELVINYPITTNDSTITQIGPLSVVTSGQLVESGSLTQIDVFGPRLENILPPSGSTFNNPANNITFDLVDQEETNIDQASINFYINDTHVISGGIDITNPLFGITSFVQVDPTFYQFQFIPANSFNLGSFVSISGSAEDFNVPSGNVSNFYYQYKVWDISTLGAMITGLADTIPPFLYNLNPFPGQIEVDVDSNILLDVVDIHTGVDPTTVTITVEDIVVYSGQQVINPLYANVTTQVVSSGKGFRYTINPSVELNIDDQIDIVVSASDLFSISPNSFVGSYSFNTLNNAHLVASGLQVYTNGFYEYLNIEDSFPITTTGNDFKITFNNLQNLGISTSGSFITCNDVLVSGINFISVSGSDIYDVYFNLIPDYTTDCDLIFHIEQSTLSSGSTVYRNIPTELLWGAEYCYDPENNFSYLTTIPVTVSICDLADRPTKTNLTYRFDTAPQIGHNLFAEIVGVVTPNEDLNAYLESNNPFFEYGKQMYMELEAEDFAGNILKFNWSFKIQDKT